MEQSTRKLASAASPLVASLEKPTSAGSALYVINLCASMTPIANGDKPISGFETYRVYQVSRKEDGRIRYRLRLGFFSDQAEAETALACIRDQYPTAFATSLADEDQRHTRGFGGASSPAQVSAPVLRTAPSQATKPESTAAPQQGPMTPAAKAPKKATTVAAAPATSRPTAATQSGSVKNGSLEVEIEWEPSTASVASKPTTAAQPAGHAATTSLPPSEIKPVTARTSASTPIEPHPELTLATELAVPSKPAGTTPNEPFHVGKGVAIPASSPTLESERPAERVAKSTPAPLESAPVAMPAIKPNVAPTIAPRLPKPTPAKTTASQAAPRAVQKAAPTPTKPAAAVSHKAASTRPALKPPVVVDKDAPLPDLDSTQTLRALTVEELDDATQPKWFAVQLAVSDQLINLETMPHLDIFAAYRLYSIASAGNGKIQHHMRIGFFKEEVSAEAVCGYLKTFFAKPTVLRISVAEYTRFSEGHVQSPVEPKAKVIEIRAARERPVPQEIPIVTMEVSRQPSPGNSSAKPNTGSSGAHQQSSTTKSPTKPVRSASKSKTSASGKHRTLAEALLAEAREVELSESAIRRLPKNSSLLSKFFGKK